MKFKLEINNQGYIKQRESFDLEFKENFHLGDKLLEYLRTLVGMANNKGGEIVFGVKDKPRLPLGMTNDKFINIDPNKINQALMTHFSHEIEWDMNIINDNEKVFGVLSVRESERKPVVCKTTTNKVLREAAIYYRHRGETKEINYSELLYLLEKEREKEKLLWIKHIEKIGTVGPQNIQIIDTYNGEIDTGNKKVLLDKKLLDKLKFVKEGQFVEKVGAPALTLRGEISGLIDTENVPAPDQLYPLRATEIQKELGINSYEFQLLINKFTIKGNPKYHTAIKISLKNYTHKYTNALLTRLSSILERYPNTIENIKQENKVNNNGR